jgi:UDPglucose 6-dehydrogenase
VKITVVGSGFVGHATGKGLAQHGHEVTFLDSNPKAVGAVRAQGFRAMQPEEALVVDTDVTMFCVPTPTVNGQFQSEILVRAVEQFAHRFNGSRRYHVVVIRSTVPPKTTRNLVIPIIEKITGKVAGRDFGVVMQPEYLREVTADQDFARPWFILIGAYDRKSGEVVSEIYRDFDAPIQMTSLEEAEFQKYVHNVFNAVKIAFFNEMRVVANAEGWNANAIFEATAESCEGIWNPIYGLRDYGPFDGSCLPKDTLSLLEWGDQNGHKMEILRSVIAENFKHAETLGRNRHVRNNVLETMHVRA